MAERILVAVVIVFVFICEVVDMSMLCCRRAKRRQKENKFS